MPGAITYNGTSLQTANIITAKIDHHSTPTKDLSIFAVAYGNKSKTTNANYTQKVITIAGQLVATSIVAMDALEDTFKGILVGIENYLDIEHNGSTRRYTVTPQSPVITRDAGLMFGDFTAKFTAAIPYGIDTAATQLDTTSGYTSASRVIPVTLIGSSEYQYPIIKVTLTSGTQLTNQSISIGNNANGQVMTVTRTWAAGDVLIIDPFTTIVTVNGLEVPFTGAVPIFKSGAQNITYADTFLTRSVTFDIKQYGYWL